MNLSSSNVPINSIIMWQRLIRLFRKPKKPVEDMPTKWAEWAQKLPKSAFIIWIAGCVSNDLLTSRVVSYEKLLEAVDDSTTGVLQHQAERFIENYYFGFFSFSPQKDRLISIFRKLVKKKITKHMVSKKIVDKKS